MLVEHFAVAVCACAGALGADGKRVDLFGVLVLAIVSAVGGGTIRDLCLGSTPVFWVQDPTFILSAVAAALVTFFVARVWTVPRRALLLADAFGLALFTISGAEKALLFQTSGVIAILLGVVTGVAGGLLRDVLRREIPLVFQPEIYLYATAAFAGSLALVLLGEFSPDARLNRLLAMALVLILRLAAIWWKIRLPIFRSREIPD